MPFEWRDFLDVARFLRAYCDHGFSKGEGPCRLNGETFSTWPASCAPHDKDPSLPLEAAFRTAIGRIYYAAFGHALEYSKEWLGFKGKKKPEEKTQEHGAVRAFCV